MARGHCFLAAVALLASLVPAAALRASTTGPAWCLPPLFEDGQRLHPLPAPSAYWLYPLLRQHQLCHDALAHPNAPRAILVGNSAVYGHPLPVDSTFSGRLNQRLREHDAPGRVYNLAWVNAYDLRDAVILHAALEYQPDLIIYPLSLADVPHYAPSLFGSVAAFFDSNDTATRQMARERPAGLEEPFDLYETAFAKQGPAKGCWARLQDVGSLARAAAHAQAEKLARWADPAYTGPTFRTHTPKARYDCSETLAVEERTHRNWQQWNVLAYLKQLHDIYGTSILVLNWPVSHDPIGDCYNVRHSAVGIDEFNDWMRTESAARGLAYIDLHDLLPKELFLDSLHPSAEGHRRIADAVAPTVEALLRQRAAARTPSSN